MRCGACCPARPTTYDDVVSTADLPHGSKCLLFRRTHPQHAAEEGVGWVPVQDDIRHWLLLCGLTAASAGRALSQPRSGLVAASPSNSTLT